MMTAAKSNDAKWRQGKAWSLVYYAGEEHSQFVQEAYKLFFAENGLNPMAFRSLKQFEAEVVQMTAALFHGDTDVVGTMTSGGTESVLMAVKTYRDLARARRHGGKTPNVIVPESAHVAFDKAGSYFDVKIVHAPLTNEFRVDTDAVRRLIDRNTILLVGSAPSYPHGMVDNIAELSEIALRKKLPLHVDACLGGFFLPFLEKLGRTVPVFDFRLPGVTSISADLHKYGYSAKGSSLIIYRCMKILQHQFFIYENWPGGIFASPAMLGTRPGGAIAAAWAAMHSLGESGYKELVQQVMETTQKLLDGIHTIPELELIGQPDMSIFAYCSRSPDVNIYAVGDELEKRGWHIDRQQRPETIHATVTPAHATVVSQYLSDLKSAVAYVKQHPELSTTGGAAMYGMIAHLPLRSMVKSSVGKMMENMYGTEGKLPEASDQPSGFTMKIGSFFLKLLYALKK